MLWKVVIIIFGIYAISPKHMAMSFRMISHIPSQANFINIILKPSLEDQTLSDILTDLPSAA